jgi:hypothetical protein
LRSGTRWKNSRGPEPLGSTTAEASLRLSGFEAEVLEPPELREAAALLARRVAAMAGTG